jgi:hypothetical protein
MSEIGMILLTWMKITVFAAIAGITQNECLGLFLFLIVTTVT